MYRKFKLINSQNKEYDLTNQKKSAFFYAPEGLGFSKNITVKEYFLSLSVNKQNYQMPVVRGEMLFFGNLTNAYQEYTNFADFIANTPLLLEYQPPNAITPYYLECVVTGLEKSEVSTDGVLHCPITFTGTKLWQSGESLRIEFGILEDESGKYYDLERPYYYQSKSFTSADIDIRADIPVPFEIKINGEVTNPQFIFSQNNTPYGIIKLIGTFDSVYINTDDRDEEIILESDGSVIPNPYNYQDFTVADGTKLLTFFDLLVGRNHIEFNCQNIDSFDGSIELIWKDLRATI